MKKLCAMLCCLMLALSLLPARAMASEADGTVDLTIRYGTGTPKEPVEGAHFSAYQVARIEIDGIVVDFTATEKFEEFQDRLVSQDTESWQQLASELTEAVKGEFPMEADREGDTDAEGVLRFVGLDKGLYLVVGNEYSVEQNGITTTYQPQPFLLCLPNRTEDGGWDYDVEVVPKYTVTSGITSVEVVKIWNDSGYEHLRPTSITVRLLKNGELYDEVVLDSSNGWSYRWDGLDKEATWTIEEVVPDGYTSRTTASRMEDTLYYGVTNTYNPPPPPYNPPPPDNPPPEEDIPDDDIPRTDLPDLPDEEPPVDLPDEDVPLADLPQTGMLWWPVPLMAACGLLLFLIGWVRYRKETV